MRVVIACDSVGPLDTVSAGRTLAGLWRDAGAQVAVVPTAATVQGLCDALVAWGVAAPAADGATRTDRAMIVVPGIHAEVDASGEEREADPWTATTSREGATLARALRDPRPLVAVDLTRVAAHDGGAAILAALGAAADVPLDGGWEHLAGITRLDLRPARAGLGNSGLVGIIAPEDAEVPLTSLRGVSSVKGRGLGRDLRILVEADEAISALARASGVDPLQPGAGGGWGAAHAVLALGGRLSSAPALASELADLARTLRHADLLVSACTSLDIGNYGGPVIRHLADLAGAAEVPFVVGAATVAMGGRELRTLGIEAAYTLDGDDTACLAGSAEGMVRTWRW